MVKKTVHKKRYNEKRLFRLFNFFYIKKLILLIIIFVPALLLNGCREPLIVFSSSREGNFEICTVNLKGKKIENLTGNKGDDFAPDWSPDGKKIAFYSTRDQKNKNDHNTEIYIMNSDGTDQKRLTDNNFADIMPAFSPPGREIAFSADNKEKKIFNLFIMNTQGEDVKNITDDLSSIDKSPDWIDESTIVFERTYLSEEGLTITEETLNSLENFKITPETLNNLSDKIDTNNLKAITDKEFSKEALKNNLASSGFKEEEINLIFSEAEKINSINTDILKTIAEKKFSRKNLTKKLSELKFKEKEIELILEASIKNIKKESHIFTIKKDGTGLKKLTDTIYKDHSPVCSPDGTKIAFTREDPKYMNIYIMTLEGKILSQVTDDGIYHDECPAWSEDGTKIVFSSWRGKSRSLYVRNTDGSDEYSLITPCPKDDILPCWSPF